MKEQRMAWRKVSKGMTQDQVRAVLGDPVQVEEEKGVTCWHFIHSRPLEKDAMNPKEWIVPMGSVLFSQKSGASKVTAWREP
jgi:outer membrane protein assembly factor BamE (lipoprotein component of BamABCDE complex)